jgi:hypothetical protein
MLCRAPCRLHGPESLHKSVRGGLECVLCAAQKEAPIVSKPKEPKEDWARTQARLNRQTTYQVYRPKCGHAGEFYTSIGKCVECVAIWSRRAYRMRHPDAVSMQERRSALEAAAAAGDKTYISGEPCKKHGEGIARYVSNRWCVECAREAGAARREAATA